MIYSIYLNVNCDVCKNQTASIRLSGDATVKDIEECLARIGWKVARSRYECPKCKDRGTVANIPGY